MPKGSSEVIRLAEREGPPDPARPSGTYRPPKKGLRLVVGIIVGIVILSVALAAILTVAGGF